MYVLLFAAAIRLRYTKPDVPRAYKVPGGLVGMWVIGGLGLVGSFCTFIIGFFPPSQIVVGSTFFYVIFLVLAVLLACFAPSLILCFKKASWTKKLDHER
jgi:hypothetical protein